MVREERGSEQPFRCIRDVGSSDFSELSECGCGEEQSRWVRCFDGARTDFVVDGDEFRGVGVNISLVACFSLVLVGSEFFERSVRFILEGCEWIGAADDGRQFRHLHSDGSEQPVVVGRSFRQIHDVSAHIFVRFLVEVVGVDESSFKEIRPGYVECPARDHRIVKDRQESESRSHLDFQEPRFRRIGQNLSVISFVFLEIFRGSIDLSLVRLCGGGEFDAGRSVRVVLKFSVGQQRPFSVFIVSRHPLLLHFQRLVRVDGDFLVRSGHHVVVPVVDDGVFGVSESDAHREEDGTQVVCEEFGVSLVVPIFVSSEEIVARRNEQWDGESEPVGEDRSSEPRIFPRPILIDGIELRIACRGGGLVNFREIDRCGSEQYVFRSEEGTVGVVGEEVRRRGG